MKCIIIEDEIPAQRVLKNYISKLPDLELEGSFQSAVNANAFLQKNTTDLILLDINLPDISGIQYIKTLINPPAIIMTTAYHEHAVESFELETICDYLVKPISFERFLKSINKAKKRLAPKPKPDIRTIDAPEHVFINVDKTLHRINIQDIIYVVSDKNYVTVVTRTSKFSYIESLKRWMDKLPPEQFIQVHKSYIVNYALIEKITGNQLMIDKEKIPIGRTYKAHLFRRINADK